MNFEIQYYKNVPLKLIDRKYDMKLAKRFTVNNTNQNIWIPNKHLDTNGNIKKNQDIDYILFSSKRQLEIAGIDIIFKNRKEM